MTSSTTPQRQLSPRSLNSNNAAINTPVIVSIPSLLSPTDPEVLLDALDNRNDQNRSGSNDAENGDSTLPRFDPIEFLNQHYDSEKVLAQQLPALRDSVSRRMEVLNDRIANALQRQSESASGIRRHVQDAKASCQALEHRVLQVREKAALSEKAVLEITADMKRLDCAKRHLQRTITTLKRLHMLVQAVEQLRIASAATKHQINATGAHSFPDYKNASHLVDAIRQLQEYFEAYTARVQPMQVLCSKVEIYQENLRVSLVFGFRIVCFGRVKALELSGAGDKGVPKESKGGNRESDGDELEEQVEDDYPIMPPSVLQGGVMFIDAIGVNARKQFIHNFCQDNLGDYLREFAPPSKTPPPKQEEKRVSSFKKVEPKPVETPMKSDTGLSQIDKRFTWFLNGPLMSVKTKFPQIFPPHWNLQANLVGMFLQLVRNILALHIKSQRYKLNFRNCLTLLHF
jgi:vacuolar protein sorting-associated protein 53